MLLILILSINLTYCQTTSILSFVSDDLISAPLNIKEEVSKLEQQGFYEFIGFYSVNELDEVQVSGNLLLTVNYNKLSQSNFVFYAKDVEFSNDKYHWFGEYAPETESVAPSFIDITKNSEGLYVFSMKLEGVSLRGLSLSDGSMGVFEYIKNPNVCYSCIVLDTILSDSIQVGPQHYLDMKNCGENCPVDILFLYTAAAKNATNNIENEIITAMKQTKSILKRSGVGSCKSDFNIVGIIPDFVFPHSNYSTSYYPKETLKRLSDVLHSQAPILRTQYHADIVILIDDNYINTFHNLEQGYFGTRFLKSPYMYAILGVSNLNNTNYALAHQLGHLFSARHTYNPFSNDPQGTYNGAVFGNWPFLHSTIMAEDGTTYYVPYLSNQYLEYKTFFGSFQMGSVNQSAAFAFINEACTVADMVINPIPAPFAAFINGDKYACQCSNVVLDVSLRNAPVGTVTYEWFSSTDGINYVSAGSAINQSIQASCVVGHVVHVKVRVTAGTNITESIGFIETSNSVGGHSCAFKKEPNSVEEVTVKDSYFVYPNPVTNSMTITSESGFLIGESIEVYDVTGKLLIVNKVNSIEKNQIINVKLLKSGNYYLIINQMGGNKTTLPFIKSK